MACTDFNEFKQFIVQFDQSVRIDKDADKQLRYQVWDTVQKELSALTDKLTLSALPDTAQSARILRKIDAGLKRIRNSAATGGSIQNDIFNHKFNIEMSIALHELMESVKGEADKARNLGLEVSSVSDSGVLPSLPKSRVAASIGRKIAFQKGYRFKRATNDDTAARIEALYYDLGNAALVQLEKAGYVKFAKDIPTIFDYQNKEDLKKDFPKNELTRSDVLSVSLDEKKLGIKPGTTEASYFLNRTEADLTDTDLGVVTEKLRIASLITQPNTIVLPDTKPNMTDAELAQWDDGIKFPDKKTAATRKAIYEKPLFVNKAIHKFMKLMHTESLNTGKSATQRINEVFGTRKNMVQSLFGLKRSDDFSIDKKESVSGQNLSKTTPLDDTVEYYDILMVNGEPAPLHMPMKIGRNGRLYYLNSVLNPHASKQSRYMLTPGEYTIDTGTADFDYLVYSVAESLKHTKKVDGKNVTVQFTYNDIVNGSPELDAALKAFDKFQDSNHIVSMMKAMGPLAKAFQGVDYVTMLTSLQAVQDIRNGKGGTVTTEFTVAADATASGGTLTFLQALGTNPNVEVFLQRIGMLHSEDTLVKQDLDDIYGLMSAAFQDVIDETGDGLGADIGGSEVADIMKSTLDLLFDKGTKNKDIREFSKDPTMVFIYRQGRNSATETISRSLADRVIDNLDDPKVREYLVKLMGDEKYGNMEGRELKDLPNLYPAIVEKLKESELPQQMFDTMKENLNDEYLAEYILRSEKVYDFLKQLPADTPFKVLPAGAVMAGIKTSRSNLQLFGMPVTKIVEVLNSFEGKDDTVLTRKEKLQKTVMDVSIIHGIDAALLYHSLDNVDSQSGVAVIHDEVRGTIGTVRAMEVEYAQMAKKIAGEYDVHQQLMEAVAAYSPEIAATTEFKTLKKQIDQDVAEKKRLISALFNDNNDALIGDGTRFESFADPEKREPARSKAAEPEGLGTSEELHGSVSKEQDFGNTTITVVDGDTSVEVLAQEYWNDIQSRLDMVEKLKICLN